MSLSANTWKTDSHGAKFKIIKTAFYEAVFVFYK